MPNSTHAKSEGATYRLQDVIDVLGEQIRDERRRASLYGRLGTLSAVVGIGLLIWLGFRGSATIKSVAANRDSVVFGETAYLAARAIALGGLISGIVYYLLSMSRSAVDQATRFEKRRMATQFIEYTLHEPELDLTRLKHATEVLAVWGSTVESAYTPPRVAKRISTTRVGASSDGGSFKADQNQV